MHKDVFNYLKLMKQPQITIRLPILFHLGASSLHKNGTKEELRGILHCSVSRPAVRNQRTKTEQLIVSVLVLGQLVYFCLCLALLSGWRSYGGNRRGLHRSTSHYGQRPHKQRRDRQHANHTTVCTGTLTCMLQHTYDMNTIRLH